MRLALAGGVGQLVLGARPRGEQLLQLRLQLAARAQLRVPAELARAPALVEPREVEPCDRRLQARDLLAELLRALGGGRLERERPQALAHLVLEVTRALDLDGDARELQLGAMAP